MTPIGGAGGSPSPPEGEFEAPYGPVRWRADDTALHIQILGWTTKVRWSDITRAGLTRPTGPNLPANFPKTVLPGLPKLLRINQTLTELPHLLLARGPSTSRVIRVLLPLGNPAAEGLLEHIRLRLGDRWAGEVPFAEHEKLLGLRPPWWYKPVGLLGCLFLGALILFALLGFAALLTGRIDEIPAFVWAAMTGWVGVVGWILWVYRKRRRDH